MLMFLGMILQLNLVPLSAAQYLLTNKVVKVIPFIFGFWLHVLGSWLFAYTQDALVGLG